MMKLRICRQHDSTLDTTNLRSKRQDGSPAPNQSLREIADGARHADTRERKQSLSGMEEYRRTDYNKENTTFFW